MASNRWAEYVAQTKNSKPRPLLVRALSFVANRNEALDLGSGALNDVAYLIEQSFKHITAVDSTPAPAEIVKNFPPHIVSYVTSTFENFNYAENTYDLINAQYALPFNPKESFEQVIASIINSLKPHGVFVGQFFGIGDQWNTPVSKITFHTKQQAGNLLAGLNIIEFTEEEAERSTASGVMKHWHVFHFIAIK